MDNLPNKIRLTDLLEVWTDTGNIGGDEGLVSCSFEHDAMDEESGRELLVELVRRYNLFQSVEYAQLRDLLRCVAWIRALQIHENPENFDLREIFADGVRAYWVDQLGVTRKLFKQLDDYCTANQIPAIVWKME